MSMLALVDHVPPAPPAPAPASDTPAAGRVYTLADFEGPSYSNKVTRTS